MSKIIIATTGKYSDYSVNGVFNILKPFKLQDVQREHFSTWLLEGHDPDEDRPKPEELINYMIAAGYVEVADHEEIHFGEYGEIRFSTAAVAMEWKP